MHLRGSVRPTIRSLFSLFFEAPTIRQRSRVTSRRSPCQPIGTDPADRRDEARLRFPFRLTAGYAKVSDAARVAQCPFRAISRLRNSAQTLDDRAQSRNYPSAICRWQFLEVQDHERSMLLRLANCRAARTSIVSIARSRPVRKARCRDACPTRARKRGCHCDIGTEHQDSAGTAVPAPSPHQLQRCSRIRNSTGTGAEQLQRGLPLRARRSLSRLDPH
jgi:hypothetical protein